MQNDTCYHFVVVSSPSLPKNLHLHALGITINDAEPQLHTTEG